MGKGRLNASSKDSAKRAGELSNLSWNWLRELMGLLTRQCHLHGHLLKLGVTDKPVCQMQTDIWKGCASSLWLCSTGRIKTPGLAFSETRQLQWHQQQGPKLCSECEVAKCISKSTEQNAWVTWCPPLHVPFYSVLYTMDKLMIQSYMKL
jgi:hypothetical protein